MVISLFRLSCEVQCYFMFVKLSFFLMFAIACVMSVCAAMAYWTLTQFAIRTRLGNLVNDRASGDRVTGGKYELYCWGEQGIIELMGCEICKLIQTYLKARFTETAVSREKAHRSGPRWLSRCGCNGLRSSLNQFKWLPRGWMEKVKKRLLWWNVIGTDSS